MVSVLTRYVWKPGELHLREAKTAAGWDESEHPRHPSGSDKGGEFAPLDAGEALGSDRDPQWEGDPVGPKDVEYGGRLFGALDNSDLVWEGETNPLMSYTLDKDYMQEATERESYRADLEQRMREVGEEGDLRITTPDGTVLNNIVVDGRFLSQFESGTSGGAFLPDVRAAQEEMFFGYPQDMPVENRPVYGWLEHPDTDPLTRYRIASQYGTVTWHVKPEVKARTTVSFVDSLSRPVIPGPIKDPGWRATVPPGYEDEALPQMVSDHNYDTGLFDGDAVETQYHGGLTLDDVDAVDVTVFGGWSVSEIYNINKEAIDELRERGIIVRYFDPYGDELDEDDVVP